MAAFPQEKTHLCTLACAGQRNYVTKVRILCTESCQNLLRLHGKGHNREGRRKEGSAYSAWT
jgi:hypothetical protein